MAKQDIHYDELIETIASYVYDYQIESEDAYHIASIALMDAIGCAILGLNYPECTKLLGPLVAGTVVPHGSRVIGTEFVLDPVTAAFNLGTMIRWLDYNDTWLAAEWGHPSDNLGGILAVADYVAQTRHPDLTIGEVLTAQIKAYEIQGILAILNSFNSIGFDHVFFVKLATTAVTTGLLGGSKGHICDALSQAFIDAGPLRTYRHAPNVGSRKSWAAGDAASRGVQLAMLTLKKEKGYLTPLTAKKWGFYDVMFDGKPFRCERPFESYVMENILFKVSYPAEFHAQTALEAAIMLHPLVKNKIKEIEKIEILTHASAIKIISKEGPLKNPADRDHCLQYIIAIGLLHGYLDAQHYEDRQAEDPAIDWLRERMQVTEDITFSKDYLDPEKRSIANAIKIVFKNGDIAGPVVVEYPIGHRKRRHEAIPLLFKKFHDNLKGIYSNTKIEFLRETFLNFEDLIKTRVSTFMEYFSTFN